MNFRDDYIEVNPYKYDAEMPKEQPKYRLVDILNKIANGELKIGSKVIWGWDIYTYYGDDDFHKCGSEFETDLWEDMYIGSLTEEVELIEPNDFGKADKMAEPTDNTKIEELEAMGETKFEYGEPVPADWVMANKINEIINKVNAQTTVVLSHEKDIEDIKNLLDY